MFLKISQNLQENTCTRASFLIKLQACNFIKKETLEQFSCEFCKIFKNTYFEEYLGTTASEKIQVFYIIWDKLPWLFSVSRYWYKVLLFLTYLFYLSNFPSFSLYILLAYSQYLLLETFHILWFFNL